MNRVRPIVAVLALFAITATTHAAPADQDLSALIRSNGQDAHHRIAKAPTGGDRLANFPVANNRGVTKRLPNSRIAMAPKIHQSFVPTPIPAPVLDVSSSSQSSSSSHATPAHRQAQGDQKRQSAHANRSSQKTKPSITDRIRDLDRRSNAWLKRTFLGG
ncbi:hypothetical protein [Roseiconus lacunae]|uniref:Uncharacterized protein n=1 Tax=Roseiconus lacunae TaxID=2605694 RepID=A0ABT7PBK0_9BACT|nr:hypothetical protein [Roseiconus lacunae]MDM4013867.1 hypothetical protein [Roseiconus lacunae]